MSRRIVDGSEAEINKSTAQIEIDDYLRITVKGGGEIYGKCIGVTRLGVTVAPEVGGTVFLMWYKVVSMEVIPKKRTGFYLYSVFVFFVALSVFSNPDR